MSPPRDWRPTASLETLRLRAGLLAAIRAFFAERRVLEVDTPALSAAAATDPHLDSFVTADTSGRTCYLHTSPEYPMKRLLASGSGSIYQIARVFRKGEAGRLHNPEFTLVEWYRLGFDHHRLMDEVEELVADLLRDKLPLGQSERLSYRELFQTHLGLDPHRATVGELAACANSQHIEPPSGMPADDPSPWLDLLLSHVLEPRLGQGRFTFVYDYPAAQAALARLSEHDPPLASRFELYLQGVELANGFHELSDPDEHRRRFRRNNRVRAASGLPLVPPDENLIAAVVAGLPDCAGVALGFDRLVMLAAGKPTLSEVIAFPEDRS